MKMVSQLTRQAMSRHRIVSLKASSPPAASAASEPLTPAPDAENVRPLYSSPVLPPEPPRSRPAPPQRQPRSIYQQLMQNHDRMSERHIRRP